MFSKSEIKHHVKKLNKVICNTAITSFFLKEKIIKEEDKAFNLKELFLKNLVRKVVLVDKYIVFEFPKKALVVDYSTVTKIICDLATTEIPDKERIGLAFRVGVNHIVSINSNVPIQVFIRSASNYKKTFPISSSGFDSLNITASDLFSNNLVRTEVWEWLNHKKKWPGVKEQNINDALWFAKINPLTSVYDVKKDQWVNFVGGLKISTYPTHISKYSNSDNEYSRELLYKFPISNLVNYNCPRIKCKGVIVTERYGQKNFVFCTTCQL